MPLRASCPHPTLLTRALERLSAEGGHAELRCQVLYLVSLDHFCGGGLEQGKRALQAGAKLASEIGATQWLARCASRLASWLQDFEEPTAVKVLVDRALEQIDPGEDLYAVLLARKAELSRELRVAERQRLYVEAERLAAETGRPEVMLEVAISRAWQRDPTQLEQSRAAVTAYHALEAKYPHALVGIQRRMGRSGVDFTAYWFALVAGDLAAAQLALAQCDAAVDACRVPYLRAVLDLVRIALALSEGRLDEAAAGIARMRESGQLAAGLPGWLMYCTLLHAEAADEHGLFAQLESSMELAQVEGLEPRIAMEAAAWFAALAGRTGNADAARRSLGRVPDAALERMPVGHGDIGTLCSIVEACVAVGDRSRADVLYAKLEPHAGLNAVGSAYEYKGSVAHYLGLLALLREQPAAAANHFEAALAFNEKLGMQAQVERGRQLLGRARAGC